MNRDTIEIEGLRVDCIVGTRPEERELEQPVEIDVKLGLDARAAGRTGRISETVDYDRLAEEIVALLRFRRFRLIEAAAEELAAMMLGAHEAATDVRLTLRKPLALRGRAAAAAVTIARGRVDYPRRREPSRFGEVEVLLETRDAGLYLLHVDAGLRIPRHRHDVMRELEWLVTGELWQDGQRLEMVRPTTWGQGAVHGYENRSAARATLFCCDTPPFIASDEIDVET